MPMAAGPATSPINLGTPAVIGPAIMPVQTPSMTMVQDSFAKDAVLSWFRGEFAAANAIIDALCGHLVQLSGGSSGYDDVFAAIHRRRLNWIPVLQMQKYHSIADVTLELRRFEEKKVIEDDRCNGHYELKVDDNKNIKAGDEIKTCLGEEKEVEASGKVIENVVNESCGGDGGGGGEVAEEEDSPDSEITDTGSHQEMQGNAENVKICSDHEECRARLEQIKLTKGFSAKESVKGQMVNVVKGLKLYEDIFTDSELSKLTDFVNELRAAGHNGLLSGDTFILFNEQMKGNRRELVQFGVPIFGQIKAEATSNNQTSNLEPIPNLLEDVMDHLVQWHLIPAYKRPNGCIINFFEEGENSQPFFKPPHLDQPISTLLLSESNMAFGRILNSDNDGNYRGSLMLSLKEGSLLVMRGNSADTARHVMCPSPSRRVSITFFRVRPDSNHCQSPVSPTSAVTMTLWQPGVLSPYTMPNGTFNGYDPILRAPVVMLAPVHPTVSSPRKLPQGGGTGVFLPWTARSRKAAKHLPPRAQKGRFLALTSSTETHIEESTSKPAINVDAK